MKRLVNKFLPILHTTRASCLVCNFQFQHRVALLFDNRMKILKVRRNKRAKTGGNKFFKDFRSWLLNVTWRNLTNMEGNRKLRRWYFDRDTHQGEICWDRLAPWFLRLRPCARRTATNGRSSPFPRAFFPPVIKISLRNEFYQRDHQPLTLLPRMYTHIYSLDCDRIKFRMIPQ